MSSNVRDEPLTHPCCGPDTELRPNLMHNESTGLTAEVNSDRGDTLVRGFWTRDTYYIVDARVHDYNQPS